MRKGTPIRFFLFATTLQLKINIHSEAKIQLILRNQAPTNVPLIIEWRETDSYRLILGSCLNIETLFLNPSRSIQLWTFNLTEDNFLIESNSVLVFNISSSQMELCKEEIDLKLIVGFEVDEDDTATLEYRADPMCKLAPVLCALC